MKNEVYKIRTKVWIWKPEERGSWHFATIDKMTSKEIKKDYIFPRRGFGSIPVVATIGNTTWKTSVFPEKEGTFLLPL